MKKPDLDGEIASLLKTVVEHFDKEDRDVRERQLRHWRRLKLYWNNFSQIYWSETARDYRIWGADSALRDDHDQDYYDRPINVFKAFLETIIAALSVQIPAINCVPDDADNALDISTAKAGDKISELIYKHNDVVFLWLHALYIYCTEGLIGCYSYEKSDESYGTYKKPKYKDEEVEALVCPNCGAQQPDEDLSLQELNEFAPDEDDVALHSEIEKEGSVCIQCATALDPALQKTKLIVPRLVGQEDVPKARICLEVYGGLYIKVANYAKKQCDTPYLIMSYETHYANALEMYPDLKKRISHGGWSNIGVNDPYEQYARLNPQYRGEFPLETVTVKNSWLRCAAFNILPDDKYDILKKKFPDGVKVVMVNDIVADYENESLDDCWTLTHNPMSDFLNHDPLGELLTNVQDIVNDLISLTLQTIEHGIEQTWVDPAMVDFAGQREIEAMPGTISPIKPQGANKRVADGFYTSKSASLSPEIFQFYRIVQELGQFVSGAMPAIFGGQQQAGSSRTASEYAMSKGMALQRLQTPWKMMTIWWKTIFAKVIPMYMKIITEGTGEERIVEKNQHGDFVNVFLRKAELEGTIGNIELEPDEQLPITDEEQGNMIMQLFQLNNQEISAALLDPENINYIKKAIKIPQFVLPGESDRQKQFEEIKILINSEPEQSEELDPATGQPTQTEQPSVAVDPDVDNHQVEASICRSWLVSDAGRLCRTENPNGYANVLLHMKQHLAVAQQQMMQQAMAQAPPPVPANNSPAPKGDNTVKGASDAITPVS